MERIWLKLSKHFYLLSLIIIIFFFFLEWLNFEQKVIYVFICYILYNKNLQNS